MAKGMERKIVYFEDIKAQNTEITFGLVQERLNILVINKLVLASTTGATARKAKDFFEAEIQRHDVVIEESFSKKVSEISDEFRKQTGELHQQMINQSKAVNIIKFLMLAGASTEVVIIILLILTLIS